MEVKGDVVRGDDGLPVQRAEPIISREDWDAVQKRLDQIAKTPSRSAKTSPLLGIAYCLDCGQPLYRLRNVKKTKSGESVNEYYRCRGWRDKLNDCQNSSLKSKDLYLTVEKALLGAIGDLEILEEVHIPAEDHTKALEEAQEALSDLLERSAGKSKAIKDVYQAKIDSLEAVIERLSDLPPSVARVELRPTGTTYRAMWEACDLDERRALLLKAGVRIEAGRLGKDWISVGRFQRPERYDAAVQVGVHEHLRFAFFVPKDLAARATRQRTDL